MSSEISLDITVTVLEAAARPPKAGDVAGRPALGAARLRTWLALALSACIHALCLLILSIMADKGLANGARPILVSLEMVSVNDEQIGPLPPAEAPKPASHETSTDSPTRPARRPALPTSTPARVGKKSVPLSPPKLVAEPAADVKAPAETMADRPPADDGIIPATPAPVAVSTQDEGIASQLTGRPTLEDLDWEMSAPAALDRIAQATATQPVVIEAKPLYRRNPAPEYPNQARRRQLEGLVQLEVLVNEAGQAAEVRVFASSGHELLDSAAAAAVYQWQFEPARRDGEPVAMRVVVPVRFSLR